MRDLSFRTRLTMGLLVAAIFPLAGFGIVITTRVVGGGDNDPALMGMFLFAVVMAVVIGVLMALLLSADLLAPLRTIAESVEAISRGDRSRRIDIKGDDELAMLADSHNRLVADLDRRDRELHRIVEAVASASPSLGVGALTTIAWEAAREVFGLIDAQVVLGDGDAVPIEAQIPGEPLQVRARLDAGDMTLGYLVGHLAATRSWEPADQDLLELFATTVGVAIRNAQLFERIGAQNEQLRALDAAKDDFLRGVGHNLQTPLTSIRAHATQLAGERPDGRLTIIEDQAARLSRMVRQLTTVSRLESGALRPRAEVLSAAAHLRRAWDGLGESAVPFDLTDRSEGWLAVADRDQLDQVLWALLDNAVRYGGGHPVHASVCRDAERRVIQVAIGDEGAGVPAATRTRLFQRFARHDAEDHPAGTGLGLYVSRELARAMGGELELADGTGPLAVSGATFVLTLPAESPDEA
jgi:signal transduction histidine kinase